MDSSNELFSDPLDSLPVNATVGDVINLDSVSQDSVPLDDTLSAEGIISETEPTGEEVGAGTTEDQPSEEKQELEGGQKAKVGSPKPFDASLFGNLVEDVSASSATDFAIEAPDASLSSLEGDRCTDDEPTQEELNRSETSAKDMKKQTSVDGFETQPIGSPGGQFQFAEMGSPFAEEGQPQSLVAVETVTAPGGQPPISSFFDEGDVAEVGDADGESFFDSFTSAGDGFPSSGSFESPRMDEDTAAAVGPSEAPEASPQPQQKDSLLPSSSNLPPSPTEGSSKEVQSESNTSRTSQDPPSSKQTLLELARQTSGQHSPEVTPGEPIPSQHSPLADVTSPHVCNVQDKMEGEPFKVAFLKTQSGTSIPISQEGLEQPAGLLSDQQELSPVPSTSQSKTPQPEPKQTTPPKPQLFAPMSPTQGEDIFAAALSTSQSDRRHDAWLSSSATQKVLANRMLALQGTEFVDRAQLTMPGIVLEDPQGDPVKELVSRYMGEAEASKRVALTANQVTHDEAGLKKLLDTGCLRAAVDLTGLLLTSMGQGKGQAGLPSKHTPQSLQIWLTRLALLIKLQQYSMVEVECEAFGNLDRPDLYFEYYPDLYPGRQGTMVPFSFRVLHAELPIYLAKYQDALNRLYHILDIVNQILFNLESGMSEYGKEIELTEDNRQASIDLWRFREVRVLYSIGNCLLSMKDFNQAASVYETLLTKDPQNASNLLSGIGRIFLQLGDLKGAQGVYAKAEESYNGAQDVTSQANILMNKAFMEMAQNQYPEARKSFDALLEIDPENFTAINNQSVCLLYMGKLKEALALLETLVHSDPTRYLDEGMLFNLCTLYELESSRSTHKKQTLLGLVGKHKGDGFNIGCLKML
ncbi:trafficking protein particle complex subunit 12-like [Patiria miniata]|uniref:Trafficking protein particle complex subunit 12 n=1 Tax=Patiria miniata TaxID=46514 RepID=A0A914A1P4_PATMI|nr:trafficking protein particle complex subunit 12-like [Patiria miniata]XP_038057774.1 trafficking protein particle complex subunit 12-like [Patiria miniata]